MICQIMAELKYGNAHLDRSRLIVNKNDNRALERGWQARQKNREPTANRRRTPLVRNDVTSRNANAHCCCGSLLKRNNKRIWKINRSLKRSVCKCTMLLNITWRYAFNDIMQSCSPRALSRAHTDRVGLELHFNVESNTLLF